MRAVLGAAMSSAVAAWIPPELVGANSTEEIFDIVSASNSDSLLSALPEQLRGENMTLDNFYKWFNVTSVEIVTPPLPPAFGSSWSKNASGIDLSASASGINPADVINPCKEIWDFVQNGKPVVDLAVKNWAAAVPKGVSWESLPCSKEPQLWGPFGGRWHNGFGVQSAYTDFNIHWYFACTYEGGGAYSYYMTQLTQITLDADAGFGWSLTATSSVSPPVNVGSATNVLSSMTMALDLNANGYHVYYNLVARGDGTCEQLSSSEVVV